MRIYFLRHADALSGMRDAIRPLSSDGVRQARGVAAYLKRAGVVPAAAYSSPLVRARDTARIVLEETASPAKLELVDVLLNEVLQYQFDDWLKQLPEVDHLLLVGHAPVLAQRARQLAGLFDQNIDLPKAGLICVETADRATGAFQFFASPKDYPGQ